MIRTYFFNFLLLAVSVAVGLVLVEAAYRTYLWLASPVPKVMASDDAPPSFSFYDRSHWEYDEAFGYTYPPGRKLLIGSVTDGRLTSCDQIDTINARGNIGPIRGDYDSAALKILLFGDSFPAFILDGETFPSKLQQVLRDKAGVDAHVVNFGRDGTGILQMFDLAAEMVPRWKPDLVIFTFISDDLDRVRIWRVPTSIDGEPRLMVTDRPDSSPGLDNATDAFILFPEASPEWCAETLAAGGTSPELTALNARYQRMRRNARRAMPNYLSLNHSFVASRVLQGNAFARTSPGGTWRLPRVALDDYRDDPRFVADLARLREVGVPIVMVHLPIAPELVDGEAMLVGNQAALWASLEQAVGKPAYRLADFIEPPLQQPFAMSHQPTDHHPSPFGMQVYANSITRILAQEGILPAVPAGLERPVPPPVAAPGEIQGRSDVRCPFRERMADAEAGWEAPLWQIFRVYRPPPPLQVSVSAATDADGTPVCRFDIAEAPTVPVEGLDWRIGHNIFFGHDYWNRSLTFRAELRAAAPTRLGDAALVVTGQGVEGRTPIAALDESWREVAATVTVPPGTTTLRLWLQLSRNAPIEPAGRIEMRAPEVVIAPRPQAAGAE